jgi:hypothetical protein
MEPTFSELERIKINERAAALNEIAIASASKNINEMKQTDKSLIGFSLCRMSYGMASAEFEQKKRDGLQS